IETAGARDPRAVRSQLVDRGRCQVVAHAERPAAFHVVVDESRLFVDVQQRFRDAGWQDAGIQARGQLRGVEIAVARAWQLPQAMSRLELYFDQRNRRVLL